MAEFLSPSERASIAANLLDLHDTFGREIVVYKEAQKVVISTDPGFNKLYGNAGKNTPSVENVPVRKVFKARVRYDTDRSLEYFGLVNILADDMIVPELLNQYASPEKIAEEAIRVLENPEYNTTVKDKLNAMRKTLGEKGVTERIANSIAQYLKLATSRFANMSSASMLLTSYL